MTPSPQTTPEVPVRAGTTPCPMGLIRSRGPPDEKRVRVEPLPCYGCFL